MTDPQNISRRDLLKSGTRGLGLLGFGAATGFLAGRDRTADTV
ncbi:MAG: hypothetical protein NTV46_13880 [Verrucomicrobia bacterium]|nr:hypothetical protein [Verrucomicrobiota bacterium]